MAMGNVNGIASTMQNPSVRGTPSLGRLLAAWLAWYTNPNHIAQGWTATLELLPKGHWASQHRKRRGV